MISIVEIASYGMIYIPSFIKNATGRQADLEFLAHNFGRILVLLVRGIHALRPRDGFRCHTVHFNLHK
jgi:hypothetical protein